MARTRRIKKSSNTYYHLISRTNNCEFIFESDDRKAEVERLLYKCAEFSGVKVIAHCIMTNHFHIACKVGQPDALIDEHEILRRIAILKGNVFAKNYEQHLANLHDMGAEKAVESELNRWRRRMHDVSEFIKTFKELVVIAYKRNYLEQNGKKHVGVVWSGRFKSTIIQDGEYLRTCVRYIELNPVRAGIVTRAADYKFSSKNSEQPPQFFCNSPLPAGTVPAEERESFVIGEERLMKRIVQLGAGKIFGSEGFVRTTVNQTGAMFYAKYVGAQCVIPGAYSTHGHKLAKEVAA